MSRLHLPAVTLCAVTSVNVAATAAAMKRCLEQVRFGDALLLTDTATDLPSEIRRIAIEPVRTAEDYSHFLLRELGQHLQTSHCLIVQWDGFILDADQWDQRFLDFDYIGATWPQFADSCSVGNGGFSLRSKRLLDALHDPEIAPTHPEDVAICRTNRPLLERRYGIRFADADTAARFSYERRQAMPRTFGFHGVFNMIGVMGPDAFWEVYRTLDHRSPTYVDFGRVFRDLGSTRGAAARRLRLSAEYLGHRLRRFQRRCQAVQAASSEAASPIDLK